MLAVGFQFGYRPSNKWAGKTGYEREWSPAHSGRPLLRRPTRTLSGESSGSRVQAERGCRSVNLLLQPSRRGGCESASGQWPGPYPTADGAEEWALEVSYRLQRRARFRFARNSSLCPHCAFGALRTPCKKFEKLLTGVLLVRRPEGYICPPCHAPPRQEPISGPFPISPSLSLPYRLGPRTHARPPRYPRPLQGARTRPTLRGKLGRKSPRIGSDVEYEGHLSREFPGFEGWRNCAGKMLRGLSRMRIL